MASADAVHDILSWRRRAEAEASTAFRAIVRAVANRSEGSPQRRGEQLAAVIFGRLTDGDLETVPPILGTMVEIVNYDPWRAAWANARSHDFMDAYGEAFMTRFAACGAEFGPTFAANEASVRTFLGETPSPDEHPWRAALAAAERAILGVPAPGIRPAFVPA